MVGVWGDELDRVAVGVLNEVIAAVDCDVVLSSSWRLGRSLLEVQRALVGAGYLGTLAGKTPDLGMRHREIEAWLTEHGRWGDGHVAVDDDPGPWGRVVWVTTTYRRGLRREEGEQIVRLLRGVGREKLGCEGDGAG